jgi:hypothetical protein
MKLWLWMALPSCWTCRHFIEHPKFSDLNKCRLNQRLDNTTGFAEEARQNERLCGLYGRWHTHWPANEDRPMQVRQRM